MMELMELVKVGQLSGRQSSASGTPPWFHFQVKATPHDVLVVGALTLVVAGSPVAFDRAAGGRAVVALVEPDVAAVERQRCSGRRAEQAGHGVAVDAVADGEGVVGALEFVVARGPVAVGDVALVMDGHPVTGSLGGLVRVGAQAALVATAETGQALAVGAVALAVAGAPVALGEHAGGDVVVAEVEVEHVPVVDLCDRTGDARGVDQLVPVG